MPYYARMARQNPKLDLLTLNREARLLLGALLFGAVALPPLVWLTGRALLGPYANGGMFAILGDFNRRMGGSDDFLRIVEEAAPLTRPTEGLSSPCWADSRGGRPFISHLLLGGAARDWLVPRSLSVLAYAERDRSYRNRLSDHCPVSVRMRLP